MERISYTQTEVGMMNEIVDLYRQFCSVGEVLSGKPNYRHQTDTKPVSLIPQQTTGMVPICCGCYT